MQFLFLRNLPLENLWVSSFLILMEQAENICLIESEVHASETSIFYNKDYSKGKKKKVGLITFSFNFTYLV